MIEEGSFRRDLYYRLCVLPLSIPPLRGRKDDIPLLIDSFKEKNNARYTLSAQAEEKLLQYAWPGNVRELRNTTEYLSSLEKPVIDIEDISILGNSFFEFEGEMEARADEQKDISLFILEEIEKSQQHGRAIGRQALFKEAAVQGLPFTETEIRLTTVSYTHLDVYKRQVHTTPSVCEGNLLKSRWIAPDRPPGTAGG